MKELKFDTGVVTYDIIGKAEVSFNPTDMNFGERLFAAFEELDKRQEAYKAEIEKLSDRREIFDTARRMDKEMREIIDTVFETDVCDALFSGMNVYAMADGLPVWVNFMLAIIDEVDSTFAREQKATNPRIAKYTKKYHK